MRKFTLIAILIICGIAAAQSEYADIPLEVRQQIVAQCQKRMGQFGEDMVLFCAEEDITAWRKIQQYPESAKEIVEACTRRMMDYGWDMVAFCIDEDLQAQQGIRDILN